MRGGGTCASLVIYICSWICYIFVYHLCMWPYGTRIFKLEWALLKTVRPVTCQLGAGKMYNGKMYNNVLLLVMRGGGTITWLDPNFHPVNP